MVCPRCELVVRIELERFGLNPLAVSLGEAEIAEELSESQKNELGKELGKYGFELIEDKKNKLVSQIKLLIFQLLHHPEPLIKTNLSEHLAEQTGQEYSLLSHAFSKQEGLTIEKYFIQQRVERAKKLLREGEMNLSEISYKLQYSSVSYLSNQFKKIVGISPSEFKQAHGDKRL